MWTFITWNTPDQIYFSRLTSCPNFENDSFWLEFFKKETNQIIQLYYKNQHWSVNQQSIIDLPRTISCDEILPKEIICDFMVQKGINLKTWLTHQDAIIRKLACELVLK